MTDTTTALPSNRILLLDWARGVAFVAMAIFHFAFDLQMFGVVAPDFTLQPEWKYFARSIASSFLFLVGFSAFLAHRNGIRWHGWWFRFAKIAGAALLVTIGTWVFIPNEFIFFGILHSIAAASLLVLLFLRMPWWMNIVLAFAVYGLRAWGRTDLLDAPVWWWTGLSQISPQSVDYVPVFPWFAPVLLGLAASQFAVKFGFIERLAVPALAGKTAAALRFVGRHSLVFYLLHQPVMIAILYSVLFLSGYI